MNLVINSQFRPFTYDEMVKPLVQYKEAYDKIEQDYSDLSTQTEMWKDIVNQTNSPEAYKMYQRYSRDLAAVTADFSKGMNINNRRALLNMRRRYAQDITPIAAADAAMKAANELRVKAGPDAIFEVGEYNSLDQFLHGKTANNNYTSRDALTKKTAAMTEAAMAQALQDPEFKKAMGDQFWMITQHTGGSYEDLMAAISNSPQAQSRFAEIKQRVMADAGIGNYDARGRLAIEDAINTGLYAGLDKPVRSFQANADHITPAQRRSMNMQSAQLALSAASAGMVRDSEYNWVYDPTKDPAISRALAKASGKGTASSTAQEMAAKYPILSQAYFYDIKNPGKSGYRKKGEEGAGHPITYSNLTGSSWDKVVQKKTGDESNTLKKEVDSLIKSHYPSASPADITWIANTYYSIQVDDNANITLVPKAVSAMKPDGPSSSVDTNVIPVK